MALVGTPVARRNGSNRSSVQAGVQVSPLAHQHEVSTVVRCAGSAMPMPLDWDCRGLGSAHAKLGVSSWWCMILGGARVKSHAAWIWTGAAQLVALPRCVAVRRRPRGFESSLKRQPPNIVDPKRCPGGTLLVSGVSVSHSYLGDLHCLDLLELGA